MATEEIEGNKRRAARRRHVSGMTAGGRVARLLVAGALVVTSCPAYARADDAGNERAQSQNASGSVVDVPGFVSEEDAQRLTELQAEVDRTSGAYDEAKAKVEGLTSEVADKDAQIAALDGQMDEGAAQLAALIRGYYKENSQDLAFVEAVLDSQSFDEYLEKARYITAVETSYKDEVDQIAQKQDLLRASRLEAEASREQAAQEERAAQESLAAAESARDEMQQVIADKVSSQMEASGTSMDAADWSLDKTAFVDEWAARIDAYLEGSPMAGEGAHFAEAAWEHGIDPRWSVSISTIESGKGAAVANAYNAWGWMAASGGWRSFSSWEEGIFAHAEYLSEHYGPNITLEGAVVYAGSETVAGPWYEKVTAEMASI